MMYWNIQSFIYELYTSIFLLPQLIKGKEHRLPGQLIISLTSYPPRFPKLHLTIKTLLSQSIKPDMIILWVSFDDKNLVPQQVKSYTEKFPHFEIRYYANIKSYKKIIPTLVNFPKAFIVTADDDIFFSKNWLQALCERWTGNYREIVAHRVHQIKFNQDGTLAPYASWTQNSAENTAGHLLFATSGAGVLYPPQALHANVTDEKVFTALCPTADDLWLFWMGTLNQCIITPISKKFNLVAWQGTSDNGLALENVANNGNDLQISNLQQHYGRIEDILNRVSKCL